MKVSKKELLRHYKKMESMYKAAHNNRTAAWYRSKIGHMLGRVYN